MPAWAKHWTVQKGSAQGSTPYMGDAPTHTPSYLRSKTTMNKSWLAVPRSSSLARLPQLFSLSTCTSGPIGLRPCIQGNPCFNNFKLDLTLKLWAQRPGSRLVRVVRQVRELQGEGQYLVFMVVRAQHFHEGEDRAPEGELSPRLVACSSRGLS